MVPSQASLSLHLLKRRVCLFFSCEAQVETAEPPGHVRSPQNVHLSQTKRSAGRLPRCPGWTSILSARAISVAASAQTCICKPVCHFLVRRAEHNQVRAAPSPHLRPSAAFTPFHPSVGAPRKVPRAPVLTFPRSLSLASHSTPNASFPFFTKPVSKARTSCACFAGVWMPVSNDASWKKCFWFAVQAQNLLGYVWELSSKMIFNHRGINDICLRLHVLRKPVSGCSCIL